MVCTQVRLFGFSWALNLCRKASPRAVSEISVMWEAADDCLEISGVMSNRIRAGPVPASSVGHGKRAVWCSG